MREWNTLDVIAYGDRITSRLNGVEVASGISTRAQEGTIGLENAGNNLMYADVRIKALTTDTTKPTITCPHRADGPPFLQGAPDKPVYDCADEQDLIECVASPFSTATPGHFTFTVTARDAAGNETVVTRNYSVAAYTTATQRRRRDRPGDARASRSARRRRSARSCRASRASTRRPPPRMSSAPPGDAALTVSDPGHLANGAFTLPQPLRVEIAPQRPGAGPVSNGHVHDHVQTGDRSDRRRAHRHLQPDAHVHAVHHDTLGEGTPC